MAEQQPQGPVGMVRKWNPGSDPAGPPDEVHAFGGYQPPAEAYTAPAATSEEETNAPAR